MKDIVQTSAIIMTIAASIVFAFMAPKGFRLGPSDPIISVNEDINTLAK